jgi:hypothetical protein
MQKKNIVTIPMNERLPINYCTTCLQHLLLIRPTHGGSEQLHVCTVKYILGRRMVQHHSQYIDRGRPNGFLTNEDDVYRDPIGLVHINVDPTLLGYDMTNQPKTSGASKPR